jgi:hypothetical protein
MEATGRRRATGRGNAAMQERLRRGASKPTKVRDAGELRKALGRADAGDSLQLEDGVYKGEFRLRGVEGAEDAPVRIEGSRKAVLDGGRGTTTLQLDQVDHAELSGFTVLGGQRGLILNGCEHNVIDGLTVKDTLAEAVHFKQSSSFNTIQNSHIADAGMGHDAPWLSDEKRKKLLGNGEGVYIGTDSSKWEEDGRKDHSNHNKVLNNYIEGCTAEAIDLKDGSRHNRIEGNHFVADERFSGANGSESLVDIKGDKNTVRHNAFVDRGSRGLGSGWHVTRRKHDDRRSGMDNTFEGNRFRGVSKSGGFENQRRDGAAWLEGNSAVEKMTAKNRADDLSVQEWRAGRGASPSAPTSSGGGGGGGTSAQGPDAEWREDMGRWDSTRTRRATRLFEAPGKPTRKLSQGEAIWVRTDSEDETKFTGREERPSWRVMVDDKGGGSDEKGRVVAEALPERFQPSGPQSSTSDPQPGGGLDSVSAPGGGGTMDKKFPAGIAEKLLAETGLDSTQWDHIADLIAKSEQDQEKGWDHDPEKFYGECKKLEYDGAFRGWTIGAFGATTGEGYNDAKALFEEFGTSAKELGLGQGARFAKNIRALGTNPKWQKAVWSWFIKEYVQPSVSALRERGFDSALTIAAVTDCSLNQGYTGKHGSKKLIALVGAARDEEQFLRRFLAERAKVADHKVEKYNVNGNGARRVAMFRKLLDRGQMDLRDKGEVRDAVSWRMH